MDENFPDESQWDETTCDSAVCQHPQCWAALRRVERGHPRILSSASSSPLDAEDKLPALTIVNISDSCLQAKRHAHHRLPEFTFTKARSLLSQGSRCDSKVQGRLQKGLPDKSLIDHANRSSKLSVLNLNKTQIPYREDVRNMVVIWIPESEKNARLAEKTLTFPSLLGKKKRKQLAMKKKSSLDPSESQHTDTLSGSSGVLVPPPSPMQLSADSAPSLAQVALLPQDLLKDLLSDEGENQLCPEMRLQLAMMKKNRPLDKSRPDSAISSKMFLTIHRLTLQRRALRYPEHLKKLRYNLAREDGFSTAAGFQGHRKQQQRRQQQRKVKTPTKKEEAKKKAKSDMESQETPSPKSSFTTEQSTLDGHKTSPGPESDMKQKEMEIGEATLKQDSVRKAKMDDFEKCLDYLTSIRGSEMPEPGPTHKDIRGPVKPVLKVPNASLEKLSNNLSEKSKIRWNPELKLLRILQASDDEEESPHHGAQSEGSLEAQAAGTAWGSLVLSRGSRQPEDNDP